MAGSLLSSNLDIIFMILSLLPTETLLRVKTVCSAWAQVISDPAFARAHSSRPAPITAFFTLRHRAPDNQIQGFKPFQQGAKFPSSISGILSSGFKAVSRNHGLLCFRREFNFLVGNPATSRWSVVRFFTPKLPYKYHGVVLIYDPAISLHFKLAVSLIRLDRDERGKHYIHFHIYSSETSSWTVSSVFTQWWELSPYLVSFDRGIRGSEAYHPCKVGGGSICWRDNFEFLVGYEISSDTYWKTPPPHPYESISITWNREPQPGELRSRFMSGYDGIIYYATTGDRETKVWRLEGRDSWVLEGEGSTDQEAEEIVSMLHGELGLFDLQVFAYDRARGALLVGGRRNDEYFALLLPSLRLEILSQGAELPWEVFDFPKVAHGNTLAPFHCAGTGIDGLAGEFSRMGLGSLDL